MNKIISIVLMMLVSPVWAVDFTEIENALKSKDGLQAEIHGADADHNMLSSFSATRRTSLITYSCR